MREVCSCLTRCTRRASMSLEEGGVVKDPTARTTRWPRKKAIIFISLVSFVVALLCSLVATRASGLPINHSVSANVTHAEELRQRHRICSPRPPDYPGCSKHQVRQIAHSQTRDWIRHNRFGQTNNILVAADLTDRQASRVIQATRENLRAILRRDARAAVRLGHSASIAMWKTAWRGHSYTLDSFPYARWTNLMFRGDDSGDVRYHACFNDVSNTTNGWAYLDCQRTSVPDGWDQYWKYYAYWVGRPGAQGDTVCKRELFVGLTSGSATGAIGGAITGPGIVVGTLAGAALGIAGGLTSCAANALADQWNWD